MNRFTNIEQKAIQKLRADFLNADQIQEDNLKQLLLQNAETEYGKYHRFSEIHSYADYVKAVPLQTYEDFAPYAERMCHGEKNILVSSPILYRLLSSGTTFDRKHLFLTEEAMKRFNTYVFYMPYEVVQDTDPGGCMFVGLFRHPSATEDTILSYAYHSYLEKNGQIPADYFVGGKDTVFLNDSVGLLYFKSWIALASENIHDLLTVFLYDLILFFQYIETHWQALLPAMLAGKVPDEIGLSEAQKAILESRFRITPERAEFLKRELSKGPNNLAQRLWPSLRFVNGIFGNCFESQKVLVKQYIGQLPTVSFSYAASESILGVPMKADSSEYALLPQSAFYEFLAKDGCVYPQNELKIGQEYELVLSTFTGLYRYRQGDLVRFEGYEGQTPLISLVGRALNISLAGEKVDILKYQQSVRKILTSIGLKDAEFSVGVDESAYPCSYITFFEGEGKDDEDELSARLDAAISEFNPDYEDLRRMEMLAPAKMYCVRKNAHRDCVYETSGMAHKKPIVRLKQQQVEYMKGQRFAESK